MARSHERGRRHAKQCAQIVGGEAVAFRPYVKQPDIWPVRLENGEVLQLECKAGAKRTPRCVLKAIEQARGYAPDAVPVAVFGDVGGEPIACLSLRDLAHLLGIGPEQKRTPQLALSTSMQSAVNEAKAKGWPDRLPPIGLVGIAERHNVNAEELAAITLRRTGT